MSNNITPPKEIWIYPVELTVFKGFISSSMVVQIQKQHENDIKFLSEQHHNEIVQQYEKKIGELLDRLVVKQDEVIELLKNKA